MGGKKTPRRTQVETRFGRPLRQILLDLAYRQGLAQQEIAELLEVPPGTVHSWFAREGLQQVRLAGQKAHEMLAEAEGLAS